MQNVATLNRQRTRDYAWPRSAMGGAVAQLVDRVLGCWHRQMSRPFTRDNRTYRVCLSCGMSRDFDTATWKTFGPYRARG